MELYRKLGVEVTPNREELGRRRTARWSLSRLREIEEEPDKAGSPVSESGCGQGYQLERGCA